MITEIPSTGGCAQAQADGVPCSETGRACETCPACQAPPEATQEQTGQLWGV